MNVGAAPWPIRRGDTNFVDRSRSASILAPSRVGTKVSCLLLSRPSGGYVFGDLYFVNKNRLAVALHRNIAGL